MIVRCDTCKRYYDDATCWTICDHGPLWAAPTDYCRHHDMVASCPCLKQKEEPMPQQGWYGVDLDGTLAHYEGGNEGKVGAPIPAMVNRVKQWLAEGKPVKIVTARVSGGVRNAALVTAQREIVQNWCYEHLGRRLEVTNEKDYAMLQLWDDRCVQVVPNTGEPIVENQYQEEIETAILWGLPVEEAQPRGITFLHERKSWDAEVRKLRETVWSQGEILIERENRIRALETQCSEQSSLISRLESILNAEHPNRGLTYQRAFDLLRQGDWVTRLEPRNKQNNQSYEGWFVCQSGTGFCIGISRRDQWNFALEAHEIGLIQREDYVIWRHPHFPPQ